MCGIFGISAKEPVAQTIFDALTMLQHRGQDAAGIATLDHHKMVLHKGNGLVRDVIHTRHIRDLIGNTGIGHVRYPTAGCASSEEAQPFYVNSPYGIVMAHNGNLTNADALRKEVFNTDLRHVNTNSDSEVLLNIFAHELYAENKRILSTKNVFSAIDRVFSRCKGGYAVTGMIIGKGLFAFRDPNGIRPLCYGKRENEETGGVEYAVSSESVALDALGFEFLGNVPAGGAIFIPENSDTLHTHFPDKKYQAENFAPCVFEYVYLARPDSIIDGVSVYKARLRMGRKMASTILKTLKKTDIDVVIPIPDSGRTAAIDLAHELDSKYREGFIKNRYIGRTFIMPNQGTRRKSVRQKLNPTPLEFSGKNVLLVDDSIVRGTTSKQIVQMAREAGAKKVYFASTAPEVIFPNVYGIDLPARADLIAYGKTNREIADKIGADEVFFLPLQDLCDSISEGNPKITNFEAGCFNGEYITGDVDEKYFAKIEGSRGISNEEKIKQEDSASCL